MRSNNLKRHMKVHLKSNENQNTTKRKCNEMDINDDVDALEKMLEEQTAKYNRKIALGKRVEKILKKGEVKQAALAKDMQEALDLYRNIEVYDEENESCVNGNYIIHKKGCICCKTMINDVSEYTFTGEKYLIEKRYTCETTNCVYLVTCGICNKHESMSKYERIV